MILALLVTAWFMQRDGKAVIHQSSNILVGCLYSAYLGEILFLTGEEYFYSNLPPLYCSVKRQDKLCG